MKQVSELFGKALDEAVPETWTTLNPMQLSRLKEKFAELIIQECLNTLHNNGYDDAAVELQKHFKG